MRVIAWAVPCPARTGSWTSDQCDLSRLVARWLSQNNLFTASGFLQREEALGAQAPGPPFLARAASRRAEGLNFAAVRHDFWKRCTELPERPEKGLLHCNLVSRICNSSPSMSRPIPFCLQHPGSCECMRVAHQYRSRDVSSRHEKCHTRPVSRRYMFPLLVLASFMAA